MAGALELSEPREPQTVRLLVLLALALHAHYDDPHRDSEGTTIAYMVTGAIESQLGRDDIQIALDDLGHGDSTLDLEDNVGDLAVRLLVQMGFEVW